MTVWKGWEKKKEGMSGRADEVGVPSRGREPRMRTTSDSARPTVEREERAVRFYFLAFVIMILRVPFSVSGSEKKTVQFPNTNLGMIAK